MHYDIHVNKINRITLYCFLKQVFLILSLEVIKRITN